MKKTKKFLTMLLILVMALSLVLTTGCGNKTEGKGEGDDTTVYNLALTTHDSPTAATAVALQAWADEMREKSDGRLNIEIHFNGELASMQDAVAVTQSGGADLCWDACAAVSQYFPLVDILNTPSIGIKSTQQGTYVLQKMIAEMPLIKSEFEATGLHLITAHSTALAVLAADKQFNGLKDFGGNVIRANVDSFVSLCTGLGASTMACAGGEMYENISKNVMSGVIIDANLIYAMKVYEVAPYIMNYNFGTVSGFLAMNNEKYEALPDDLKALIDNSYETLAYSISEVTNNAVRKVFDEFKNSATIYPASDEVSAKINEITTNEIHSKWKALVAEKGEDGDAMLEKIRSYVEEAEAKYGSDYFWIQE